jgi:hypothetical protein
MAYTKTTWVDEVLSGAERFDIKTNVGASIYDNVQISLKTTVTTPGTSVDAAHLNNLENGVDAISTGAALSVKGRSANSSGAVADITAGTDGHVLRRSGTTLGFGQVPNSGLVDHSELIYLKVFWFDEVLATGDGKMFFTVPAYLNGGTIEDFDIACFTASSSGLPTVQMANCGANPLAAGTDILSTRATIDVGEFNSMNAAAQPVINQSAKTLATGDILRIDVDVIGTGTKGLDIFFEVKKA